MQHQALQQIHKLLVLLQVHEKSILLALLPITLLAVEEPVLAAWLPVWATVSMYPLLKKDGLSNAYVACFILWSAVAPQLVSRPVNNPQPNGRSNRSSSSANQDAAEPAAKKGSQGAIRIKVSGQQCLQYLSLVSLLPAICIHTAQFAIKPPARFLHIYDAAFVTLCFALITLSAVYLNIRQWTSSQTAPGSSTLNCKHD